MNGAASEKVRICAGSGRRLRDNGASVAVRRHLTPVTGTDVSRYEGEMYLNPIRNSRTYGASS